jgi:hypothetical protein
VNASSSCFSECARSIPLSCSRGHAAKVRCDATKWRAWLSMMARLAERADHGPPAVRCLFYGRRERGEGLRGSAQDGNHGDCHWLGRACCMPLVHAPPPEQRRRHYRCRGASRRAKSTRGGPSAASACGRRRRSCGLPREACTGSCEAWRGGSRKGNSTFKKRAEAGQGRRWGQAATCIPLMHGVSLTWQPRRDVSVSPYLTASHEAAAAAAAAAAAQRRCAREVEKIILLIARFAIRNRFVVVFLRQHDVACAGGA